MNVLFTSDLHLGHRLASEKRGYSDINYHDWDIIEQLNKQCNKRTILWILGDVAMNIEKINLLNNVPGRLHMIFGNHDNFQLGVYNKYFDKIHGFLKYKQFWLSHCPIHPQEMYRCKTNIHGHIHKHTNSPNLGLPYFNVNWDFWGRAIDLNEIKDIVDNNKSLPYM